MNFPLRAFYISEMVHNWGPSIVWPRTLTMPRNECNNTQIRSAHKPTSRQVSMRQAGIEEDRLARWQRDVVEEVDGKATDVPRELTVESNQ